MRRMRVCLLIVIFIAARSTDAQVHCVVRRQSDSLYTGRCMKADVEVMRVELHPPRADTAPLWRGKAIGMQPSGDRPFAISLSPSNGTVRQVDAWHPLIDQRRDADSVTFSFDPAVESPPTAEDLTILKRARGFLSDSERWNRSDDGEVPVVRCPPADRRKSIFCALNDASVAVAGYFDWGRPAIAAIRQAIIDQSRTRYQHWLTGFNADPTVDFAAVQQAFDTAIGRVERRLANAPPRPATSDDR